MRLRRVYIKKAGEEIASEACYAAWRGFTHKAYPLDFYEWDDLRSQRLKLDRATLVVGGTVAVHLALRQIGVPIPSPLNVPQVLQSHAGRRLWTTTLGELRQAPLREPVFIKPLMETKSFAGSVIIAPRDLERLQHLDDALALLAAEPVELVSEWRYFVCRNNVVGLAHYKGDCFRTPDAMIVRQAIADYHGAPIAYAIDFGATSDGRTLLIEANDAFALGSHGIDCVAYAEMLEARWLEIVGLGA